MPRRILLSQNAASIRSFARSARSIAVEMATKPLSVFTTPGRLPYRQRHFAAYRIRAFAVVVFALIGVIAIVLLVLGLLNVHVVTEHFRIH
jgi:hypothetical protein